MVPIHDVHRIRVQETRLLDLYLSDEWQLDIHCQIRFCRPPKNTGRQPNYLNDVLHRVQVSELVGVIEAIQPCKRISRCWISCSKLFFFCSSFSHTWQNGKSYVRDPLIKSWLYIQLVGVTYIYITLDFHGKDHGCHGCNKQAVLLQSQRPHTLFARDGNKELGHNSPQGTPQSTSSKHNQPHARHGLMNHKRRLMKILAQPTCEDVIRESLSPLLICFPIRRFYLLTFAGFTAWSSEREPAQTLFITLNMQAMLSCRQVNSSDE
jgi:hypothetical protein